MSCVGVVPEYVRVFVHNLSVGGLFAAGEVGRSSVVAENRN